MEVYSTIGLRTLDGQLRVVVPVARFVAQAREDELRAARLACGLAGLETVQSTVRLPARRSSADNDRSEGGKPDTTYEGCANARNSLREII